MPIGVFAAALGALSLFLVAFPLLGGSLGAAQALRSGDGYCTDGVSAAYTLRAWDSGGKAAQMEIRRYGGTSRCAAPRPRDEDDGAPLPGPYQVSPYARPVSNADVTYEAWRDPDNPGAGQQVLLPARYVWHTGLHPLYAGSPLTASAVAATQPLTYLLLLAMMFLMMSRRSVGD